jgi:hypothetical protein
MIGRLDTQSKRAFFAVMATGVATLVVSLGYYFSSPYRQLVRVEHYYGWTTAGPGTRQADVSYTVDNACAAPLASAAVERARADLAAHLATKQKPATRVRTQLIHQMRAAASITPARKFRASLS